MLLRVLNVNSGRKPRYWSAQWVPAEDPRRRRRADEGPVPLACKSSSGTVSGTVSAVRAVPKSRDMGSSMRDASVIDNSPAVSAEATDAAIADAATGSAPAPAPAPADGRLEAAACRTGVRETSSFRSGPHRPPSAGGVLRSRKSATGSGAKESSPVASTSGAGNCKIRQVNPRGKSSEGSQVRLGRSAQ